MTSDVGLRDSTNETDGSLATLLTARETRLHRIQTPNDNLDVPGDTATPPAPSAVRIGPVDV